MYSYSKFVKHILTIGILDLLSTAQTIIFLPVITKLLGVESYGIWSQIKITMWLLVPFTFLGLSESLLRFLPGEKNTEKIREGLYSSLALVLGMNLIMASFFLVFSGQISVFLKFDQVFVKFLALIMIFESLNGILLTLVRVLRETTKYFWLTIFKMLGETGLVIGVILLGYGLYGAVVSSLAIRIIIFIILLIYTIRKIRIKIPDFSLVQNYLKFGLPRIMDGISYWFITSVDRYFIGFFWGIVFVGYYAPAYSIGMILNIFLFPVAFMLSTILPKFFDESNMDEVKNYLSFSLKYFLSLAIPASFGLSILSRQLLLILSTQEIADAAYSITPIIVLSMFLYGVSYFFCQIMILTKKTNLIAIICAAGAFLNIILNIMFIPKFGILAASLTTLVSYVCIFSLTWYFAFKEFQFKIEWGFIIKSVLSSLVMVLFIFLLNPKGLLDVILSVILGVLIYIILIFLFKGFGRKEIIFLKNFIKYEMVLFNK